MVNENHPGVLAKITDVCAKAGLNIAQQINQSKGNIDYNVIDLNAADLGNDKPMDLEDFQRDMTMIDGVLSTRIIFGAPGVGFARNVNGQYVV